MLCNWGRKTYWGHKRKRFDHFCICILSVSTELDLFCFWTPQYVMHYAPPGTEQVLLQRKSSHKNMADLFRLCPPPSTLCAPQLQSTCHYIVNHHVKILQVRLGGANYMRSLSWGGGGTNGKDPIWHMRLGCKNNPLSSRGTNGKDSHPQYC